MWPGRSACLVYSQPAQPWHWGKTPESPLATIWRKKTELRGGRRQHGVNPCSQHAETMHLSGLSHVSKQGGENGGLGLKAGRVWEKGREERAGVGPCFYLSGHEGSAIPFPKFAPGNRPIPPSLPLPGNWGCLSRLLSIHHGLFSWR